MAMALPELTVEQWPATSAEPLRLAKNGKRYSWQDFKRYYRAEAEKEWAEAREAEEVQPAENMSGDESSEAVPAVLESLLAASRAGPAVVDR